MFAPLDGTGPLSIVYKAEAGGTTHVILDVTGYFEPGTGGLRFVPINPARIMDTRPALGPVGHERRVQHRAARTLPMSRITGACPPSALAITGNLTVTTQTFGGYVSVTPDAPPPAPPTSTINFPVGDAEPTGSSRPLNASGQDLPRVHERDGQDDPPDPRPVGLLRVGGARSVGRPAPRGGRAPPGVGGQRCQFGP